MGEQKINALEGGNRSRLLRHLLDDIDALEQMIGSGMIESGITRIGAEQELCLVGNNLRPAMQAAAVLEQANDAHLTSELARWNLEINLDPLEVRPGCLKAMHGQLDQQLDLVRKVASKMGLEVVLTGILPSIRKSELDFNNMTPLPRYKILDSMLKQMRGEDFALHIEGVDEINLRHDSILFEACNTSFQVHLQVDPENFVDQYNWAQVLAGPVLAIAANSPILFGKELWHETRIALFKQSIETRHAGRDMLDRQPRVAFGNDWLRKSAVEVFKDDVTNYKFIFGTGGDVENSLEQLKKGIAPKLRAVNLHNGTLYKWNRTCYGVSQNRPHLRIENRYLPSGPTTVDEMANTVLWIGAMLGMPKEFRGAWDSHFYFQDVRSNFIKAARNGIHNSFQWFGEQIEASKLILEKLLPLAVRGLTDAGLEHSEFEPYLKIIEHRAEQKRTGASWIVETWRSLQNKHSMDHSLLILTQILTENGQSDVPVHEWPLPDNNRVFDIPGVHQRVDSVMVTSLVTVLEEDLVIYADRLMKWNGFHHLPVENGSGELVGIVSSKDIAAFREAGDNEENGDTIQVAAVMSSKIVSISPEESIEHAKSLMSNNECGSLPVVRKNKVIGIITANDIARIESSS